FPAYLESVIASFYERGGLVRLADGATGSVTIGGTVSPAGGNFDEPVTQATLKVVGAFHGLSSARSDARRYPSIDPLDSWSHYRSIAADDDLRLAREVLQTGAEVNQMMKVVGEEGTSLADFVTYLKAEYLDAAYLQQDAYHEVDCATSSERQALVFNALMGWLRNPLRFANMADARHFFQQMTQATKDWNQIQMKTPEFDAARRKLDSMVTGASSHA
ncbi:MAG: V-type ATP synthase subunit A, partial [Lysobacterales bacterium]